jgi:hypothetical protein
VVSQKLTDYIKQQLQKGGDRKTITKELIDIGWEKSQVEEAFNQVDNLLGKQTSTSATTDISKQAVGLTGPFDLLKEAWDLYKARIGTFLGVVLLPMLVLFLLVVLFVIGGIVIQMWGQVALVVAVRDSSEAIGIKESFRRGRSKILSYWWLMCLSGLIVMGGYMLFVIPGVVFSIWFSFALYVLVSEDVRGMNALLKSREYVKGRWWAVFGRLLFIGLVSFTVYVVPSILFEFLDLSWVGSIYSWLVSLVLTPIVVAYSFLLYENIKSVKGDFEFTPTTKSKVAFIVVGILGFLVIPAILFAVVLVAINPAEQMSKARDAVRRSDQMSIKNTLEMYYIDEGAYPIELDQLVPEYLLQVPKDSDDELEYEYVQLEGGASYELCVDYESKPRECVDPSSNLIETFPSESYPVD